MKRYLVLENGEVFAGLAFGAPCDTVGELVFTTGMNGYIETLTDPSYCGQIVLQTFPLIGNYGIIPADFEGKCCVRGYVVREQCTTPSNFRCEETLDAFLKENHIPGIAGIDTRAVTRILREAGTMNAAICASVPEDLSVVETYAVTGKMRARAMGFLTGEGLTFIFICIYVFVKRGSRRFGVQSFSLIPEDFGAADDCCLDVSVTAAEDVVTVSKQASDFCKEKGLAKRTGSLMALAVEEMSNNIIEYGFADGRKHSIDIRIVVSEGETILRIRDNCIGFDPVKYLELHQGDDPVAHIGIKMVMKLVKDANYVNSLGLNNLRLTL